LINFYMDDLLRKSGIENKYELIHLVMGRVRQLIREKDKILENNPEKLCARVLREIVEGRLKPESLKEEYRQKETPLSSNKK